MSEWRKCRLEEVARLKRGFDLPSSQRKAGPFPVMGSAGISGWHDEGPIIGPAVVLGRAGASMGVASYCAVDRFWPLNTSLFVEDFLGNDPRYIFYLFQVTDLTGFNSGSVQPMLNRNYIRNVPVIIPNRAEQEEISSILGSLDEKMVHNDQIVQACHNLAQAYSVAAHSNVSSRALGEIAIITMGSSPPGDTYNELGTGIPFYQGTKDFGERFPSRRVWCSAPVRTAKEGSTLLSVRAPVGRVNIAREQCCIGRGVASLESRFGTPSVVFHELSAASEFWKPYESEGTVFGAINKAQIEQLHIPALDEKSALRLEERLRPLDERVANAVRESETLREIRETLLPRLMSGQIRVRDAERIVEAVT